MWIAKENGVFLKKTLSETKALAMIEWIWIFSGLTSPKYYDSEKIERLFSREAKRFRVTVVEIEITEVN